MSDKSKPFVEFEARGANDCFQMLQGVLLAIPVVVLNRTPDEVEADMRARIRPGAESMANEHIEAVIATLRAANAFKAAQARLIEVARKIELLTDASEGNPS